MSSPPENAVVEAYLDRLRRHLRYWSASEREDVCQEVRSHLESLTAAYQVQGREPGAAQEEAMRQFGDPEAVGRQFAREKARRRPFTRLRRAAAVVAAALVAVWLGLFVWLWLLPSRPLEHRLAPTPLPPAAQATTLAAILAAHDGFKRDIQSLRCQTSHQTGISYARHWPLPGKKAINATCANTRRRGSAQIRSSGPTRTTCGCLTVLGARTC